MQKIETRGRPRNPIYEVFCAEVIEDVKKSGLKPSQKRGIIVQGELCKEGSPLRARRQYRALRTSRAFEEMVTGLKDEGFEVNVFYRSGMTTVRVRGK